MKTVQSDYNEIYRCLMLIACFNAGYYCKYLMHKNSCKLKLFYIVFQNQELYCIKQTIFSL
jgi:hypothetical protein